MESTVFTPKRPKFITLLAILNIFESILLLVFIIVVLFANGLESVFVLNFISICFMAILLFLPPIISFGLLKGKVFGWIGELALAAIFTVQFIVQILTYFFGEPYNDWSPLFEPGLIESIVGVVIGSFVIEYLLRKNTRNYFLRLATLPKR